MKDLLARKNIDVLTKYAKSKVVLAFDFDGTLAPIVGDRYGARMRKRTRLLLEQVGLLYPCVVISGRSRRDTLAKTKATNLCQVIGNHGLEPGNTTRFARQIATILPKLRQGLKDLGGIEIENKRLSLAVHYRRARSKPDARLAIDEALARLAVPVRAIPGKMLVNVLPKGAPNKGQALQKVKKALRVDKAVYVGDDITDEDVFELKQPDLLTVRIGKSKTSAATHFLRNQAAIDRLLMKLIALRSSQRREAR